MGYLFSSSRQIDRDNQTSAQSLFAHNKLVHAIKCAMLFSTFALGANVHAAEQTDSNANAKQKTVLSSVKVNAAAIATPYESGNTDIPRTEDDVQPYKIIDRDVIERSGATSVEELLQQQLTMSTSAPSESGADGFGGGASKINLRGLGANQTLVLINGRRAAGVGNRSTSDVTDQPNLNNIPLAAIERIEVLPTSAAAIYGSGAIGGVVNVILRRDYVGTEVNLRYGDRFDGNQVTKTASLVTGFALEEGRTQVLFTAQKQDADALLSGDSDYRRDGRQLIANNNPNSIYGMNGTRAINPPAGALVNIRTVDGSPIFGTTGSSFTHIPKGYQGAAIDGLAPLIANAGTYNLDLAGEGLIGQFAGDVPLIPAIESEALSLSVNRDMTDKLNVFIEGAYNSQEAEGLGTYYGTGTATLAANAPNNPFGKAVLISYPLRMSDMGIRGKSFGETETKTAAVGFTYKLPQDWIISADHSWSKSYVKSLYQRQFGTPTLAQAINAGTVDLLRDTTSFATDVTAYANFPVTWTEAELNDTTIRGTGTLTSWYAGKITLATGIEHRAIESAGVPDYTSPPPPPTLREQTTDSIYAELDTPFISPEMGWSWAHLLDVQVALRRESFDVKTSGAKFDATTPTVGFRFAPDKQLMLRASYSEGFVAPTYSQLAEPTLSATLSTITDPKRGNEQNTEVAVLSGGNPDLQPEESESINAGLVFTPDFVPNLRWSFDYYHIKKDNNISSLSAQQILADEVTYANRITRAAASSDGFNVGRVTQIYTGPTNALSLETKGFDTSISYVINTDELGSFTLSSGYTYVEEYLQQAALGAALIDHVNIPSRNSNGAPLSHRANASIQWFVNDSLNLGWSTQYYGAYDLDPASVAAILNQGSDKIDSQIYHDLYVRTALFPSVVKSAIDGDAELTLGVKNVFDKKAIDMSQGNYYSRFNDPRLRQFYVNLKVSF
ncbi:MAG: TonB-dependent receptor [Cellvibrio sp.]|uniref:TonB-dependent receptor domain-containing protein n=1 Tax=Cellvibrio sp. TaxID=1965322 RepID=UPI0031B316D1